MDAQRYSVRKEGDLSSRATVRFRESQLNASILSNAFSFVPSTISLVSETGEIETPDDDGHFPTSTMSSSCKWVCKGAPFYQATASARDRKRSVGALHTALSLW